MVMIDFKACPRCGGDVQSRDYTDSYKPELNCVQCGAQLGDVIAVTHTEARLSPGGKSSLGFQRVRPWKAARRKGGNA